MNEQQPQASHRMLTGGLVVACVIVVAALVFFVSRRSNDGPAPNPVAKVDKVSAEEARRLIRLAQLGNGYLENFEYEKAVPIFEEIAQKLPNELLGLRNLAICRHLQHEANEATLEQTQQAIDALEQLDPESPVPFWLRGRVLRKADPTNSAASVDQFVVAAEKAGEDERFKYALFETSEWVFSDEVDPRTFDALRDAYALAPDNIFILSKWLSAQAKAQDDSITMTIEKAKETLQPLRNSDADAYLTSALEAVRAGKWPQVAQNVGFCWNLIKADDFAQSDRRWLTPHPLEYMQHEFSQEFTAEHAQSQSTGQLIDVVFEKFPEQLAIDGDVRDALFMDFNLDEKTDLAVLTLTALTIYSRGDSGEWKAAASAELTGAPRGLLAADLDFDRDHQVKAGCFDADADFVVYGDAGVNVFRNTINEESGARVLEEVKQDDSAEEVRDVLTGILVDFDHDCILDLVLATKSGIAILQAPGNKQVKNVKMEFTNISQFSSFPALPDGNPATSLVAVDWDRDVDTDVLLVAAGHAVGYLENLRHGNFRWREFDDQYGSLSEASSLAVIEVDANVSWDILGAGKSGISLVQTRTPYPGAVQFMDRVELSSAAQDGMLTCDFDNNGYQDVIAWTADSVTAWRGDAGVSFSEEANLADALPSSVKQCRVADVDSDGDLDLCVIGSGGISLYANEGGNKNYWLTIRALGQADNKGWANHHGIGSLIEVKAGAMYQAQVVSQPVTHIGLGQEERAAIVRFLWTNGVPQDVVEPERNQAICEEMKLLGSCPYIYTWTGERYEFFTDCLWAAPIGLQLAEDVVAATRSWEYLRIPGDRLQPRDGKYWLQLTEELWEAGYFDHVRLIAVDHPTGTEVFSNEKVGPASISEYKLHTVRQRRYPVAANDQRGRDVLTTIRYRDENFLRAFDRTVAQGVAEDHYLELDLGELVDPEQVTLFMTGWIFPTNTSMNVSLSKDPLRDGPRPPSLHVPDENGEWQQVQAYMGFPGGKTKTIAVDLSKAFLTDDYRVRVATNAQIYWDEVFFTVDEEPVDLKLTELDVASAELHYRGFSRALPPRDNAPERYDYADRSPTPKWPPMRGSFTRYGDVLELLREPDDRMAVLGSGDELTVSFEAPREDPPEGWTRTFVLHNVGYDKDADLNTIYGQTAEPLPYRAMTSYPYPANEPFPQGDSHADYLRRYQTRSQEAAKFWRSVKEYEPSRN